jgi:uncharacterized damage-inducible protein DinB
MTTPVSPEYVVFMVRYNAWMNGKVYDASARLDDVIRKRDLGAFFGSVHGTLNHLLYGDLAWLGRFRHGAVAPLRPNTIFHEDFDTLRMARERLDDDLSAWAATVTPDWLARPFRYVSFVDGMERTRPAWILVAHMFNHQTHHRGQITTLLSQLGEDIGVTDLAAMPQDGGPI